MVAAFARLMLAQLRRFAVILFCDMLLLDAPFHRLVRAFDLTALLSPLLPEYDQQNDPAPCSFTESGNRSRTKRSSDTAAPTCYRE